MSHEKETGAAAGSTPLDDPDEDGIDLPEPVEPDETTGGLETDPIPSEEDDGEANQ